MVFEWPDLTQAIFLKTRNSPRYYFLGPNGTNPIATRGTLPVARPGPKPQAQNPTRTMKKVARPSPNIIMIINLGIIKMIRLYTNTYISA